MVIRGFNLIGPKVESKKLFRLKSGNSFLIMAMLNNSPFPNSDSRLAIKIVKINCRLTDKQIERQTDNQRDKHSDRESDRETGDRSKDF